jgi:hypothetical protein
MKMSPGKEEIKKLSDFLSEMHIAHYIYEFSLHIPGEATYVSFDDPFEIRIEQNNGMVLRVLKSVENGDSNIQVETWKNLDSVIFNIRSKGVEVVYHGGELEIRFLY